jgi:hypothetical protein
MQDLGCYHTGGKRRQKNKRNALKRSDDILDTYSLPEEGQQRKERRSERKG